MDLKFKRIGIEDKNIIENYFLSSHVEISEYTFTNLFVWRNSREVEYAIYKNGLIILANYQGQKYFLPPLGFNNYLEIISELIDFGLKINVRQIKRLNESEKNLIISNNTNIIEDKDNFDYLYNTLDLAFLKGRRYSSKKNLLTNFFNNYEFDFLKYDDSHQTQCLKLSREWIEQKSNSDITLQNEYFAINELIKNYKYLSSTGNVLLINGIVVGFAFGEKHNKNTFVVHFEKANSDFKGIYQAINKIFIEKEVYGKFDFVNREQDLGISGIRKAKESYFPIKMVKKYTLIY